ncbi:uncharacterized protein LOC106662044 [Cimex lectularius]|uniref:Uncharacterized protein n=1 Tax=Cimex lectularius TaxID=79782 RepID=A0A8I6SR05_CIMLE|nr:uncharacterized protein LOC106662044 [Cimex lectularius]
MSQLESIVSPEMGCRWLLILCLLLLLQLSYEVSSYQNGGKKGVKRQIFKRRGPGFFGLLSQFVRETISDTNYAVRNITNIINNEFPSPSAQLEEGNSTSTSGARQLSLKEVNDILGRNYRSLVRLFNTEFRKAVADSNKNVGLYRKEFRDAIRPYFTGGAFTSTTTPRTTS